jgi:hypothetical protein
MDFKPFWKMSSEILPGGMKTTSEFKVNKVAGVAIAILVAIGIAGAVLVLSPTSPQNTSAQETLATLTWTRTSTLSNNQTVVATETGTVNPAGVPLKNPWYLSNSVGQCTHNGMAFPCIERSLDNAHVFMCAGAADPSGCTVVVRNATAPQVNFNITIWYPSVGQTGEPSSDNCKYEVAVEPYVFYGYCMSVGASEFIISTEGPPRPF